MKHMTGEWLKKVVFCMCFLELIYQLVPKKTWQRYLKFTGGLIFMLIFLEPVLELFSATEKIQDAAWKWQIQESSTQLKEEQEALAEFQNEQVRAGVCRELEKQITQQIEHWDGEPENVKVTVKESQDIEIEKVEIILKQQMKQEAACRSELQAYWGLEERQLVIRSEREGAGSA